MYILEKGNVQNIITYITTREHEFEGIESETSIGNILYLMLAKKCVLVNIIN